MTAVIVALLGGGAAAIAIVGMARRRTAKRTPRAGVDLRLAVLSRDLLNRTDGTPDLAGVCAAAVDWHVGSGVATLVTHADGAVSLYQSAGGGIIGAGQHESVRAPGLRFLALLRNITSELRPTDEYPLPASGQVTFWLVFRDKTLRSDSASVEELSATYHPFHAAMGVAQATITALREHQGG